MDAREPVLGLDPGIKPGQAGLRSGLLAQQRLLLIDIFLRNVASRDESVHAGLGHVYGHSA